MTPKCQANPTPKEKHENPREKKHNQQVLLYFVLEEYLVTALVPSDTACLASSPGRIRRTLQNPVRNEPWRRNLENVRGLDLAGRDCGLLVVSSEFAGLSGNALKDVWK
jgi:hypothetical protein